MAQEQGWCKNGKYEKAFGVGEGGNPIDFAEGSKGGLGLAIDTFLKLYKEGLAKENGEGLPALLVNHDPSPYKETKAVFGSDTAQWQANNPKYVPYMEKGQNIVPVNSAMYAKLR